jgi:hypothetical protein
MGIRADIRDELKKESVTKIHGQPTSHDLTILEKEIIAILANIPTALGGGNFGRRNHHGSASIFHDDQRYRIRQPSKPRSISRRTRSKCEHKELISQFETFEGVRQGVKDLILEAVDNEDLIEIKHVTIGFLNQTPRQMLEHLLTRGGALDFADTKELLAERDGEWNISENPQLYFNRVEKAMKGLQRNGINSDTNEQKDIVLFYLNATGEFDASVREWEAKPAADKTWANIKTFISAEYAKENKQNKLTAKQFKANAINEQAESNRRTHCGLDGSTHQADGDPNQEYNRHHEINDDTA